MKSTSSLFLKVFILYSLVSIRLVSPTNAFAGPIADFADKHCMECHDADSEKGGFNIEPIFDPLAPAARADLLSDIIGMVERGEMPPKKEDAFFQEEETKAFVAATSGELLAYYDEKKKSALGSVRRLRSRQFVNSIQDLLGYPLANIESILPDDDKARRDPAEVTDFHLARYVRAADGALTYVIGREARGETMMLVTGKKLGSKNPALKRLAPRNSEKGVMLIGRRTGRFSTQAEMSAGEIKQAGLYRVKTRVIGHNGGADFRIAVRSSSPTSNQVAGVMGSRGIHSGTAAADVFTEAEIEAYFDVGDQPVVQKMSSAGGPGNFKRFKIDNPEHTAMWVHSIEVTGPIQEEIETTRQAILGNHPATRDGAAKIIAELLPRAFRGPVSDTEVDPFLDVYDRDFAKNNDHLHALREALKTVLVSSRFLYRNGGDGPLDDYEIATRLSYALWNTTPDETLFNLAAAGRLSTPEAREQQIERMLTDAKSDRFVRRFTDYWLQLHRVGETKPGFRTKPAYDAILEENIRTETRLFFREILHRDLDVADFLDSDWAMLNENMATLYGLAKRGITGPEFRRVALQPDDRRGGLLGQSSFACLTSNGSETQPILRGVWILSNLLNQRLEPPKNVEPIETDARGAKSMLDQIRLHRDAKACQGCHIKIDPLGIALENYGVIGNWRDTYRSDLPIVTTVEEYSDLSGMAGVKEFLAGRKDEFRIQLINKIKEYILGRDITYYDLHRSRLTAAENSGGLKSLLKAIVADESFVVR